MDKCTLVRRSVMQANECDKEPGRAWMFGDVMSIFARRRAPSEIRLPHPRKQIRFLHAAIPERTFLPIYRARCETR
jgi:hypothetical protein